MQHIQLIVVVAVAPEAVLWACIDDGYSLMFDLEPAHADYRDSLYAF